MACKASCKEVTYYYPCWALNSVQLVRALISQSMVSHIAVPCFLLFHDLWMAIVLYF